MKTTKIESEKGIATVNRINGKFKVKLNLWAMATIETEFSDLEKVNECLLSWGFAALT